MSDLKCPSCNTTIQSQNKFCPECGVLLSKKKNLTQAPKNNPKKDMLIVAFVAIVAIGGYWIFIKPEPVPVAQQQVPDTSHQHVDGMGNALSDLPTDYNSLVQLGNQTMDEGHFPMAAECYKRALNINDDSPNIRTDYGACLHGMGLPNRAIEEFMKVIKEHPEHTIANFNLGIVYYSMNNVAKANMYFDRFLELEPEGRTADAARTYISELAK